MRRTAKEEKKKKLLLPGVAFLSHATLFHLATQSDNYLMSRRPWGIFQTPGMKVNYSISCGVSFFIKK